MRAVSSCGAYGYQPCSTKIPADEVVHKDGQTNARTQFIPDVCITCGNYCWSARSCYLKLTFLAGNGGKVLGRVRMLCEVTEMHFFVKRKAYVFLVDARKCRSYLK